jgi:hypothetical protein
MCPNSPARAASPQALLMVLVLFCFQPEGFRNRQLRPLLAQLLGISESKISPGRMSYDLRRLRLHGLMERIPKTQRYRLTTFGLKSALDMLDAGTASPASPPGEMEAVGVFSVGPHGELNRLASTPTGIHVRTGLFVPSRRAVYVAVPMRDGRDPEIREYKIPF